MTENTQDNELLTVLEVSRIFRVDSTTIRRWIKQGILDAITLPSLHGLKQGYRIKRETVDKVLGNI